jgi:small-conductance mechanosensitive channel
MRIIQKAGAGLDKVTSIFGHVAQEVTGKQVFNPNSAHSIVIEALEKNRSAEALARRIWMSFVVEGRENLLLEDVQDVLGPNQQEAAEEAFAVLDRDGNGDISLDEMILTITEFGRERKAISSSMHDVDQAINVLDRMLAIVVFIIVILIFVAFLNKSFATTLATTGTALISLSFVFAVTAQEVLGSCIFLFVKHPFDIGDRVDIQPANQAFVVEHISLLYTVFRHVQGTNVGQMCQIPNIVLNTLWVENVTRSKAMTEQIMIDVAFETSFDDLQILKNEMLTFVTDKDNSRDFQNTVDIDIIGTSDQSKLTIMAEVKHKSNWSNESIRRSRRSKFMCALVSALKAVPIYPPGGGVDAAGSAANPTYSVGISHSEAKEHADEASQGREQARLIPKKKIEEAKQSLSPITSRATGNGAGMTANEVRVVDDLTSRNPAIDSARDEAWTSSRDDSSDTLGERPSVDRSDLDQLSGMLRRESTRGKRKISTSDYRPTIPTINEPSSQQRSFTFDSQSDFRRQPSRSVRYSNYQATSPISPSGDENQTPGFNFPAPGRSMQRPSPSQYQTAVGQQPGEPVEMSQMPPQRSPSNPYRQRGESVSRRPLDPPNAGVMDSAEEAEADFGQMSADPKLRPYSGV